MFDLARRIPLKLTSDPADDLSPVWTPDGALVVFRSNRKGVFDLYQRASGGAGQDEVLFESPENKIPTGFSPDGKILLFNRVMPDTRSDVWALPTTGERKPFAVISTPFNEGYASFSPDGRWIAYDSDDSGAIQVYVEPFPTTGMKVRLSAESGVSPVWSEDAKSIFYSTANQQIMAVDVQTSGGTLRAGVPQDLFLQRRAGSQIGGSGAARNFFADPSGQRFLMLVSPDSQDDAPITVVLNWKAGLQQP